MKVTKTPHITFYKLLLCYAIQNFSFINKMPIKKYYFVVVRVEKLT